MNVTNSTAWALFEDCRMISVLYMQPNKGFGQQFESYSRACVMKFQQNHCRPIQYHIQKWRRKNSKILINYRRSCKPESFSSITRGFLLYSNNSLSLKISVLSSTCITRRVKLCRRHDYTSNQQQGSNNSTFKALTTHRFGRAALAC